MMALINPMMKATRIERNATSMVTSEAFANMPTKSNVLFTLMLLPTSMFLVESNVAETVDS